MSAWLLGLSIVASVIIVWIGGRGASDLAIAVVFVAVVFVLMREHLRYNPFDRTTLKRPRDTN